MITKKPWFKAKSYGWGWVPVTWQGWAILAVFILILIWDFRRLDATSHSNSDTVRPFVIQAIGISFILIGICYLTGEKPRWRWGNK